MQGDCNLVLTRGDSPQWATGTNWYYNAYGYWFGCSLVNPDGRVVVYAIIHQSWIWYTQSEPGAALRLYGDGGLALIKDGRPVWWASGYNGNYGQSPYTLVSYQLSANQTLYAGDVLSSPRGLYRLDMQSDCNLVLYTWEFWRGHDYRSGLRNVFNTVVAFNPIWATDTSWKSSECRAVFQGDGNLVVYDWQGRVMWASGTYSPGAVLRMQDDGNLVIYDRWGRPVWATNTMNQR
jgi:hypothetical protein